LPSIQFTLGGNTERTLNSDKSLHLHCLRITTIYSAPSAHASVGLVSFKATLHNAHIILATDSQTLPAHFPMNDRSAHGQLSMLQLANVSSSKTA
jgi:hypothetical protein